MSAIDDLRVAMDTWLSTECETAAVSLDAAARMFSAAEAVLAEVDAGHLVDVSGIDPTRGAQITSELGVRMDGVRWTASFHGRRAECRTFGEAVAFLARESTEARGGES